MGKTKELRRAEASNGGSLPPAIPIVNVGFANQFASPTFCIRIGPSHKEYHLHKNALIARSHYFKHMLASSFIGKEVEDNTVILDSEFDHEDAFNIFVEFLYTSSYSPPEGYDVSAKASLHARVYGLAERLGINKLKDMAFVQMSATLTIPQGFGVFGHIPPSNPLDTTSLIDIVDIVYHNTPGTFQRWQTADLNTTQSSLPDKAVEDRVSTPIAMVEPSEDYPAQGNPTEANAHETTADAPGHTLAETSATDELSTGAEANVQDKMRVLIARYAASSLDNLRQNSDFLNLLQRGGDFVVDLVMALSKSPNVTRF